MRLLLLAVAITTSVLALSACGDDKKDSGTTTPTTTGNTAARGYDETGSAISEICAATDKPGQAALEGINGKAAHDAPLLVKAVDIYRGGIDQMRKIDPDPKLKDAYDRFIQLAEDQVTLLEEMRDKAQSGTQADYKAATNEVLQESATTEPARKKAARALGATECAKD